MADVPAPSNDAEERIRGIVESYVQGHGQEDDLDRAVESLRTAGEQKSRAVIDKYRNTWENDSSVDPQRVAEIEEALHDDR